MRLAARLLGRAASTRCEELAPAASTTLDRGAATPAAPENQDHGPLIAEVQALSTAGRYGEALARVVSGLGSRPGDCELLFARASVLFNWGRIREAREGFVRAEANGLSRMALYLNLAWSCHLLHSSDHAERYARKAIELDSSVVAAHFGLGTILQRLKQYPAAMASYERALELAPEYADAAAGVANCKLEQHEYVEAEDWMRRVVALAPEQPQFWTNLGVALANQERYADAFEALRHAGEMESAQGAPAESVVDRGFALILMGEDHAAADLYRQNLADLPDPRAHGHYALALLALGQFREGWEQYEFRWLQDPHLSHRPNFTQPVWAGQQLAGKTILLRAEQGAGDIIQFARFAVPFKALGATVVLQVRPELVQLAQGFAGADRVFAPPTPPPPFDYYVHLMGCPHALGTELATIPAAVPYLQVDPMRAQQWAARIEDGGLKVGLAWAGNPAYPRDRHRSMPLDALSPLWQLQGVRYFSLQKPLKPGELEQFPTATTLVNLEPDLGDFADTAAVIARLDLIICVDTSIAHLAGALGKPVWLMLPEIGDFRWLKERDDSPWYPTMRLFRQQRLGQWDAVVERVKDALQEVMRTGSLAVQSPPAAGKPALNGAATTMIKEPTAARPTNIASVKETRYGIMQYVPDADRAARSIAWYGEFLQPQLDLVARLVRPGAHVVEAGSGVGAHALSLAKMVGVEGQLFLYEPRPIVQRILRQNLQVNRLAQSVTLMRRDLAGPQAVSRQGMEVASGNTDSQPLPDAGHPTETLDELLLERLDLLKIQSAAVASDIIDGASQTLWRLRPLLFIAAEDSAAVTNLAARVKGYGYRCWCMQTPLFNPGNFNRRDTDIFDAEAALAVLAIPEEINVANEFEGCVEVTDGFEAHDASTSLRQEPIQSPPPDSGATLAKVESGLSGLLRKLLRFGRLPGKYRAVKSSTYARTAAVPALTPAQYVEEALVHHGAGRIREAEVLYLKALAADPDYFDALHLLGVMQQQAGESAKAVASMEKAISVAPGNCIAHNNLGLAYRALNRLDKAEAALRLAIALQPDWDRAHNNLGTVLHATGRLEEAKACFAKSVQLNPSNTEALNNLGNLCKERGEFAGAEEFYRRALALDPATPGIWKNLGQVLQLSQRLDDAMDCYRKALALQPEDANVLVDIGTIHEARTELVAAERCFRLALQIDGNLFEAMCNLGAVLGRLDRLDEAELYSRKSLVIRPDDPSALSNLAAILLRVSALDEADRCCRRALSIRHDHVPTQIVMGSILNARERPVEAAAHFRQALRLSPKSGAARYNLSMLKLLQGDYREGFELYESRFDALRGDIGCVPEVEALLKDDRRWHGEVLRGQRLLIWTEQGFGDSLMMLRYLPLLKTRDASEINVQCEPALERVVCSISGLDQGVSCLRSHSADQYDLHCPIMSLPFLFTTTLNSIPDRVPYVAVPGKLADAWKVRLSSITKPKIGLAWAGSKTLRDDARRSIPLSAFEPLMRSGGAQLISLQKGAGAEQAGEWRGHIENWMDDCHDFMDTAALIHNLDLVISVDSAMAHLAGALGKPVWLLNRYGSEWRWGLEGERSPWYPSMRIFRQREAKSWDRVIAHVTSDLASLERNWHDR